MKPLKRAENHGSAAGKRAGNVVAKVIAFYTPKNFKRSSRVLPPEERGKIIELYPGHCSASCPEQHDLLPWTMRSELLARFADCLNEMRLV